VRPRGSSAGGAEAGPSEVVSSVPSTVSASGAATAASPSATAADDGDVADARPRLTSQQYQTWIWAKPRTGGRFLGTIRVGSSVALRSTERVAGQGCPGGFFRIEPRGYVCADRTVTLEPDTPFLRAVAHSLPDRGPFPYRYALSNGAPMYNRIPTARDRQRTEWRYGPAGSYRPLGRFQRGHEALAVDQPIAAVDAVPSFLLGGGSARGRPLQAFRRTIPHGSMLSYTRAFEVDGQTYLLSADLTVVPADRVRPFRRSRFRGIELDEQSRLPIAWFRGKARPQYHRLPSGRIEPNGKLWPVRSAARPTGTRVEQDGRHYLELVAVTAGGRARAAAGPPEPRYAEAADVTVAERLTERPFGVPPGAKWIAVSITAGTLVAYRDLEPVYVTLVSPGQGGVPIKGRDPVKYSTTPLGAYRITYKDRAATMSPEKGENRSFWIADVPYTQYFNPPFALHGAYWHESFGEPMSAGCLNVSPIDAELLFEWTDPPVPEGWQGVTGAAAKENGPTSVVVVQR